MLNIRVHAKTKFQSKDHCLKKHFVWPGISQLVMYASSLTQIEIKGMR